LNRARHARRHIVPRLAVGLVLLLFAGPVPTALAETGTTKHGPVILVVLEELPLSSLQKADGEIDEIWYPAFAELAASSTWIRGHSSMANRSLDAVPAIVSGRLPSQKRLWPVFSAYPNNLFTLLEPTHEMNVVETQTRLQPPPGVDASNPQHWKGGEDPQIGQVRLLHKDGKRPLDEPEVLRSFARSIAPAHARSGEGRGSLHFVHVMFPMSPWRYTPTGQAFFPYRLYGNFGTIWSDEPWWPEEAFRRHLLQARFTDALLGELLAELHESGLYDEALLVVTASLGASFWPGDSLLYTNRMAHPGDGLAVPLFIKRPGQDAPDRIEGVSEAMDLLPSIADLLGIEVPFPVDGCSLFDASCPPRTQRSVLSLSEQNGRYIDHFAPDVVDDRTSLEHRIAHYGSGAAHDRFYRFGPYAAICGKSPDALADAPAAGRVKPHRRGTQWAKGESGPRFGGILHLDAEPAEGAPHPQLALALNGRIETVVPVPRDRRNRRVVSAVLPEEKLSPEGDTLEVFIVTGDPASPTLAPVAID
jgi:hypothetical protein